MSNQLNSLLDFFLSEYKESGKTSFSEQDYGHIEKHDEQIERLERDGLITKTERYIHQPVVLTSKAINEHLKR